MHISGVGAERSDRENGCQKREKYGKRVSKIQIAMIRVQTVGLYVEMVGYFKATCTLILTSNQRHKK